MVDCQARVFFQKIEVESVPDGEETTENVKSVSNRGVLAMHRSRNGDAETTNGSRNEVRAPCLAFLHLVMSSCHAHQGSNNKSVINTSRYRGRINATAGDLL